MRRIEPVSPELLFAMHEVIVEDQPELSLSRMLSIFRFFNELDDSEELAASDERLFGAAVSRLHAFNRLKEDPRFWVFAVELKNGDSEIAKFSAEILILSATTELSVENNKDWRATFDHEKFFNSAAVLKRAN